MRRTYPRLASLAALILGLLALTLAAQAGEVKKGEKKGEEDNPDQAKLQGTWELTKMVVGGKESPSESLPAMRLIIKDDSLTRGLGPEGKGDGGKSRFKLDSSKQPKEITLIDEKPIKGIKVLGIYELKGDTLTLATNPSGVVMRPKGFGPKDAGMTMVLTFKRAKKK